MRYAIKICDGNREKLENKRKCCYCCGMGGIGIVCAFMNELREEEKKNVVEVVVEGKREQIFGDYVFCTTTPPLDWQSSF